MREKHESNVVWQCQAESPDHVEEQGRSVAQRRDYT